jgi:hypothetical protein
MHATEEAETGQGGDQRIPKAGGVHAFESTINFNCCFGNGPVNEYG